MEYLQFVVDNIFTFAFEGTFGILCGIACLVVKVCSIKKIKKNP